MTITKKSLKVFIQYAKDAGNWGGTPLIDGSKEERGNLTQLKKENLIKTFTNEKCQFIRFTEDGIKLAKKHGVEIEF